MATSKKYLSLEEAASLLKIKTEELIRFREKGEIRGFADRGTWKFKAGDVEEFARRRQPDSDPDVGIIDDDFESTKPGAPKNAVEEEDDELGRQATVIRKGRPAESDSDVRSVAESSKKGDSFLASPSSEIQFNDDDQFGQSEIMPVDSVIHLADSEVLFADSEIQFTQSEVQLFGRGQQKEVDSDSDVKLVNLLGGRSDSDSDVKLFDQPKPKLKDSDSDVKLAKSDSDVKVVKTHDSDSDVQLIDHSKKKPSDSDSDVKLMLSDSDSDVKLIKQRAPSDNASSDSDVALLPASKKDRGKPLDNDPSPLGSALYDDDPGITLPGDSGIQLAGGSGIRLAGDSGIRMAGDSGIRLAGDSPNRLAGDSGIQLQQPADSGILLEGHDSGLTLDHRGDSGIRLSDDSGMKLLSGSSKNLKGGSSKNIKGRGPKPDSGLELTAPMMATRDERSDDDLSSTAPMLLRDDDLSDDDLQVPLLTDDTAAETNVIMFEDDESDQTSATVVRKGRQSIDESAFDLEEVGEESVDDELEVSDDVLGEDDELEDLDAFASDEDELDENFESGASRIGFGTAAAAGKISAPLEVEWSTGVFISLIASCLVLLVGAVVSADLLKTTWAAGDASVYQGELLEPISSLYK